ncbi:hypothetical protein BHE74_00056887, partial [Ensete ventricosum]
MKIEGFLEQQPVSVLIDTRSMNNYMNSKVDACLMLQKEDYSSSDDVVGPRQEFARRFIKWIRKLAGNMMGNHQKKTKRLTVRISKAIGLAGFSEDFG